MSLIGVDVAQTRINLHPDKSLRQLSSSRLANRRIHAYHSVIAMSLLHPALLMITLFCVLRIRSMKFDACTTNHFSPSCQEADPASKEVVETTGLPLTEKMALMPCVISGVMSFLLVVMRQRLLLSGDVELNPGPLDDIDVILYSVDDTTFDEDDWNDVIKECSSLAAKWEHLSGYLGLSIGCIDTIKKNFSADAAGCWNEALKHWIQQNYRTKKFGLPSWRTLLEAVARVDKRLFKILADKHQGNNIPSLSDAKDEMEANERSEAPIQALYVHPLPSASASPAGSKPHLTFPYLNLTEMTKEQKHQLHQRLYAESMDMIQKFQDLFSATTESLKQRKISIDEILCHLIGLGASPPAYKALKLPAFCEKFPELQKALTIDVAMLEIGKYCSFFNYYMIEHIINKLGTTQDKKNLDKYKKEFRQYAEHLVFECPSEVGTMSDGLAKMVVTLDETYENYTLKYLELFVSNLRKILNISSGAMFKLCQIDPGSLKLTFQLHHSMVEDIFPLTREQEAELAKLGVDSLSLHVIYYQFNRQQQEENAKQETAKKEADTDSGDDIDLVSMVAGMSVGKSDDSSSIYSDSAYGTGSIVSSTYAQVSQYRQLRDLRGEPYLRMEAKLGLPDDSSGLELHQAAYRGELDRVKQLIEEKELNPLQVDKNGDNALHYTAGGGHLHVMKYLIEEQGLNPACQGQKSRTPLHCAAVYKHLELVKYLVGEQHMDPLCQDEDGYTPLFRACRGGDIDVIQYLISEMKKHTSLDSIVYDRTKDGDTAVNIAALDGHLPVVKLFISELNFDPNTPGQWGRPPLTHAAEGGHLHVVRYFIEELHCDPSYAQGEKDTPLHMASLRGHLDVIRYLTLNRKCSPLIRDSYGNTPLHNAALDGRYEVVKFFISELNCDPNTPGQWGRTPLHGASEGGHLNIVRYLIDVKKCNPASLDNQKTTPLHVATIEGHLHIVKYLIEEKHCNLFCYDKVYGTPLHWAAYYGQLNVIKYFVEVCNCPLNIRNSHNQTPLELAHEEGHTDVVHYLSSFV